MNKNFFFPKTHIGFLLLLLLAVGPFLNGCFIKSIAINSVADGLASEGDTFSSDNRPRADPPSHSLQPETHGEHSFLDSPARGASHRGLQGLHRVWLRLCPADSDYIADQDYAKSKELNQRAKNLYLRALGYGLRGLDVRHDKFSQMLKNDPKAAVAKASKNDIELLYWTGLSWMAAISIGKDDPELISELPQAEALIYRAYALNPDYDKGALHEFLITYEGENRA